MDPISVFELLAALLGIEACAYFSCSVWPGWISRSLPIGRPRPAAPRAARRPRRDRMLAHAARGNEYPSIEGVLTIALVLGLAPVLMVAAWVAFLTMLP